MPKKQEVPKNKSKRKLVRKPKPPAKPALWKRVVEAIYYYNVLSAWRGPDASLYALVNFLKGFMLYLFGTSSAGSAHDFTCGDDLNKAVENAEENSRYVRSKTLRAINFMSSNNATLSNALVVNTGLNAQMIGSLSTTVKTNDLVFDRVRKSVVFLEKKIEGINHKIDELEVKEPPPYSEEEFQALKDCVAELMADVEVLKLENAEEKKQKLLWKKNFNTLFRHVNNKEDALVVRTKAASAHSEPSKSIIFDL